MGYSAARSFKFGGMSGRQSLVDRAEGGAGGHDVDAAAPAPAGVAVDAAGESVVDGADTGALTGTLADTDGAAVALSVDDYGADRAIVLADADDDVAIVAEDDDAIVVDADAAIVAEDDAAIAADTSAAAFVNRVYDRVSHTFGQTFNASDVVSLVSETMEAIEVLRVEDGGTISGPKKKKIAVEVINRLLDEIPDGASDRALIVSAGKMLAPGIIDVVTAAFKGQVKLGEAVDAAADAAKGCLQRFCCC